METSNKRNRLLFVVNADWFFLSHRLPIALAAKEQGYEVHVAAGDSGRLTELRSFGFVPHSLRLDRRDSGPLSLFGTLIQLHRLFVEVRPDIVHLVTIKPVLLGGIAARIAAVPAVVAAISGLGFVFVSNGWVATLRRFVVKALYRIALGHRNACLVFQNPDDRASICSLKSGLSVRSRLIRGSGVNLSRFVATPCRWERPVVLMAARLLADKGVREFVLAARILRNTQWPQGCNVRFVLIGSPDPGNPTGLTESELAGWEREGIVELWGHRDDMHEVLPLANIVVLPSYREGLPKVLIEAAACGRAVITTNVPGCRDAIEESKTGLLVPAKDSESLAHAIRRLIEDPELCTLMGCNGRVLAETEFDVGQVVAKHLGIYSELLRECHRVL